MQTLNKFCCCKSYIWIIVAVRLSPYRFLNFSQDNFKASLSLGFLLKSVKQKGLKIVCQSFLSTVTQILGLLKCWPLWNEYLEQGASAQDLNLILKIKY